MFNEIYSIYDKLPKKDTEGQDFLNKIVMLKNLENYADEIESYWFNTLIRLIPEARIFGFKWYWKYMLSQ